MPSHDPLAVPSSASSDGHRVVLAVVVAVSAVVAVVLTVAQGHALGDEPLTMLGCGSVLAFAAGVLSSARAMHVGIAAMGGFPIVAVVDLCLNGGHTMLPFEFAFYAICMGIGVALAHAGQFVGARFAPRTR